MVHSDSEHRSIPSEAIDALEVARHCLGPSLKAAYLYGSAVAGGLRPDSDVDVMLVVDRPLDLETRLRLLNGLLRISGLPNKNDPRRPLEVVIFNTEDLSNPSYPARSEFLYGEWLRAEFEAGAVPEPQRDADFTMLLAKARQNSQRLTGPGAQHQLPEIPDHELRRAIGDAVNGLLATIKGDERNVLLTLARMWCTLQTGKIVPKDFAAEWAMARLSGTARMLMKRARLAYLGVEEEDWSDRSSVELVARSLGHRVASLI